MIEYRNRPDMRVYRDNAVIIKEALSEKGKQEIKNALRFYRALQDTPYIPELIDFDDTKLVLHFIEEHEGEQDNFRRNCIHLIFTLRNLGIQHGDLTRPNFIVNGDVPVVIDWGESTFVFEDRPLKRPESDAYYLYRHMPIDDTNRILRRWLAVREHIKDYKGWGKLVDLGTLYGDLAALAQSEYFLATGVDNERIYANSLQQARQLWKKYGCKFINADLVNFSVTGYNIGLLFSTWAYIVQDYGVDIAKNVLARFINELDVLFFETQLFGDGPGPSFLETDEDVRTLLSEFATHVEPIVSIDVAGRDAIRTVWKVIA